MTETEEEKKAREAEEAQAAKDAESDAKLNGAIKNHMARLQKQLTADFSKMLGDQVAAAIKASAPVPPVEEEGKGKGKPNEGKGDPAFKLLQEQMEQLKKSSADDRAARVAAETKARRDSTRASVRELLDAKGIKGAKATALVSHFEATSLRFNEEGEPIFAVSRSRTKGAAPEELEFDIAAGIEDWSKTPEAAEFLPAPNATQTRSTQRVGPVKGTNGVRHKETRYEEPAVTDEEAAQRTFDSLTNQGVDVNALLNE